MEQNLKQRLVGAIVLISLAVIFLPLIFDKQQQRIDTSQYRIPEKPAMTIKAPDTATLDQQVKAAYQPIANIEQQKQAQDAASAAGSATAAAGAPAADTSSSADPAADTQQPHDTTTAADSNNIASSSPSQAAVKQYLDTEKKTDSEIHNKPASATVPLAESWILQVGAFSSQTNAEGLRNKLKADGYAAFVKPMKVSSSTLYKVYVGPEIRRYQLEKEKTELERKYKLKALILQYIP